MVVVPMPTAVAIPLWVMEQTRGLSLLHPTAPTALIVEKRHSSPAFNAVVLSVIVNVGAVGNAAPQQVQTAAMVDSKVIERASVFMPNFMLPGDSVMMPAGAFCATATGVVPIENSTKMNTVTGSCRNSVGIGGTLSSMRQRYGPSEPCPAGLSSIGANWLSQEQTACHSRMCQAGENLFRWADGNTDDDVWRHKRGTRRAARDHL